jgi:hypothetical protein
VRCFLSLMLLIPTIGYSVTKNIVTSTPPTQGIVQAKDTSAGVTDAAKIPLLNPAGKVDVTALPTGTSGTVIPLLDGTNTWSGNQTINAAMTVNGAAGLGYIQLNRQTVAPLTPASNNVRIWGSVNQFNILGASGHSAKFNLGDLISTERIYIMPDIDGTITVLGNNTIGTGSFLLGSQAGSGAEQTISFQPGLLTAVTNTKGVFGKFVKDSTVDNITGSAIIFTCAGNPTITLYECGTDTTCASSPTTIGSVTVTAAGTAIDGTVSNPAITAGDYVAWAISSGTCTTLDVSATAQVHAN